MCSVNEEFDDAIELIPEETCQILANVFCQKCNLEKALILLKGKDVYCNTCFLASATHKFRATLGRSKIVRPTDKILVTYTGNAGSTALLHLIRAGMYESLHKRLVLETKVFYIDDGAVKGQSLEDRETRVRKIRTQINFLGFELYAVSLNRSLKDAEEDIENLEWFSSSLTESLADDEALKNIFDKLPDYTSKVELLYKLRQKLIFSSARKLGCNKVLVADDSTSLAIDILSNVALGRGAQLSLDIDFLDTRYGDVTLLRPMRNFTRHELDCYLNIHSLETVDSGDLEDPTNSPQSIQSLTEKFVNNLDCRFHGTVSTVFRTGEKICAGNSVNNRNSDETCVLCDAPLDTASDAIISVIQATSFSRLVASPGPNRNIGCGRNTEIVNSSFRTDESSKDCRKCNATCSNKNDKQVSVTPEDLRNFLCYGCGLIFRNSNMDDVPICVLNAVNQRLTLKKIRNEITDFLL